MQLWRICRARHTATAFSGEGARRYSGRWHPAGVPVVYTSLSLSLAALETFVHLDPLLAPADLVSMAATLPGKVEDYERISLARLPADWLRPNHPKLQKMGADWVRSAASAALIVPSAVVEGEWTALLNPSHPAMRRLKLSEPRPFQFGERMFR